MDKLQSVFRVSCSDKQKNAPSNFGSSSFMQQWCTITAADLQLFVFFPRNTMGLIINFARE